MIPVPGAAALQQHLAGAVTAFDVMMKRTARTKRHEDHVALGGFRCLADGFRHFACLAVAEANAALLVADDDERGKAETTAALHHFRDAVNMNELVYELALNLFAWPTVRVHDLHVPAVPYPSPSFFSGSTVG